MKQQQTTQVQCPKHQKMVTRLICSMNPCQKGNFICDNCLQADSDHINIHRNFIFEIREFFNLQSNMTQKFLPQLNENLIDIEKKFSKYSKHCENQCEEIDKDFAQLFKIFFTISENAKTFLKDNIKEEQKNFQQRLKQIRQDLENLSKSKQKDNNFFSQLFSKEEDTIQANSNVELIEKLIERNAPLNQIRSDCIILKQNLDQMDQKKVTYKQKENQNQIFEEIRDDFELGCKEMYRKFKQMMEGSQELEMKKTMFNPDSQEQDASNPMKQSQTQTITMNLSRISSVQSLKNSLAQFDNEKSIINIQLKKLDTFPPITNQNVLGVLKNNSEGFNLVTEGSYFNNIPEQGPFQYEDGSVYFGHMQNHKRHGRGKFLFIDGAFYQGYWKNDIPFGFGRLIRVNGDNYEGMCQNFKANGKGTFTDFKGQYIYKGDWIEDRKQGQGEEIVKGNYKYKGEFKNGIFHGSGEIVFDDGTLYNGDFLEGQITGQGSFNYPTGEQYLGFVQNGKKHGRGIFIWSDGRKYEGNYQNDLPDGQGLFFWPDGYVFNGQWKNGLQNGKGIEINPDLREKVGIWEGGVWQRWM